MDRFADQKGHVLPVTYYGINRDIPLEMQGLATDHTRAG